MIINQHGADFLYKGITYRVGDEVIANEQSEYAGLLGKILEIRDGEDKDTENETPDIYCSFQAPSLPEDKISLERRFSERCGKGITIGDMALDEVIMAPEMLILPKRPLKTMRVYLVQESWFDDGVLHDSTRVFANVHEAVARFNDSIREALSGEVVAAWKDYDMDVREQSGPCFYEAWCIESPEDNHYFINLEEREVSLTPDVIGDVGRTYLNECMYEDFASQVEEWEDVGELPEEEYQRYLADERIPNMIEKGLSDTFWECYWEAVSEAAHTLLREYTAKNKEESK